MSDKSQRRDLTKVLCLIPARSGSKGIPHKNVREVAGKPLMAWSIGHALASRRITRTIVSTDSEAYARVAREHGAETPFLRPAEFSGDQATDLDVFQHALNWLRVHEDYVPELCVHLRPTCPIRDATAIDEIVDLLSARPELDSVRTVTPVSHPPFKMWFRDDAGLLSPVVTVPGVKEPWNEPRQRLPPAYLQTANIDVVRTRVIVEQDSMSGQRIHGYVEPLFHDIDTPEELDRAACRLASGPNPVSDQGPKTFCFDIDGVIATKDTENDYARSGPVPVMINRIRRLHALGHRIILFTARGSMTGIDWQDVTRGQMRDWGVPYHELKFGKPAADFYVDDRLIRESDLDWFLPDRNSKEEEQT